MKTVLRNTHMDNDGSTWSKPRHSFAGERDIFSVFENCGGFTCLKNVRRKKYLHTQSRQADCHKLCGTRSEAAKNEPTRRLALQIAPGTELMTSSSQAV